MTKQRSADTIAYRQIYQDMHVAKTGILVLNLGSPDAPTVPAVRKYLREFLMDPFVINLPYVLRWVLVNVLIVPFRSKSSAEAYRAIWLNDSDPAPLIKYSKELVKAFTLMLDQRQHLKNDFRVALAFRYGNPSLASALKELLSEGVEEILLLPQYPHHADSTRTTSIEKVKSELASLGVSPNLGVLPAFYKDPAYIAALVQTCRDNVPENTDHLLFSFHGLPEQHILDAGKPYNHCLKENCCQTPSPAHATCYRHQVYTTAKLVAESLGIESYSVCFQSRLGRQQWLRPYTDHVLQSLPKSAGELPPSKNIAVICPAFTADNLETLEEIDIRGRQLFMQAGGKSFTLVPCLNDNPTFVKLLVDWCLLEHEISG